MLGGHSVEQWLEPENKGNEHILKWVCMEKEPSPDSTYTVILKEVFDNGGSLLQALPVLDVDEPEGKILSFKSSEDALKYVINELGGALDRFVRAGDIQQEYEKYFASKK